MNRMLKSHIKSAYQKEMKEEAKACTEEVKRKKPLDKKLKILPANSTSVNTSQLWRENCAEGVKDALDEMALSSKLKGYFNKQ